MRKPPFYIVLGLVAVLLSGCDSGVSEEPQSECATLLGICPEYNTPPPIVNGLFQTVVNGSFHGAGHTMTVDERGDFLVGGHQHTTGLSDLRIHPVPTTYRFNQDGNLVESGWHDNIGLGTISSVRSEGGAVVVSSFHYEQGPLFSPSDPVLALHRLDEGNENPESLFSLPLTEDFGYWPDLDIVDFPGVFTSSWGREVLQNNLAIYTQDGGYALLGLRKTVDEHDVYKLNAEGTEEWRYQISGPNIKFVNKVAEGPGGDLFLLGLSGSIGYNVSRLTSEGIVAWEQWFGEEDGIGYFPHGIAVSDSTFYVLAGQRITVGLFVIAHSMDGEILWTKRVKEDRDTIPGKLGAVDITTTSTGKIVVSWGVNQQDIQRYPTMISVLKPDGELDQEFQVAPSYERVTVLAMEEYAPDRIVVTGGVGRYFLFCCQHDVLVAGYQL